MEQTLYIILGWLLALLSPRIIDNTKKLYLKNEIRDALFCELDEIRYTQAFVIYNLLTTTGKADKNILNRIGTVFKAYKGFYKDEEFIDKFNKFLIKDDSELDTSLKGQYDLNVVLSLKRIYTPFLDTQTLSIFSPEFQQIAYDIKRRIRMINEEISISFEFNMKTFDSSIIGENHERVKDNVTKSYVSIANMLINLVTSIDRLLKLKK